MCVIFYYYEVNIIYNILETLFYLFGIVIMCVLIRILCCFFVQLFQFQPHRLGCFSPTLVIIYWLVVSNMFFPFHIWDVILPIDELIFFKMVIAPTSKYHYNHQTNILL